MQPRAGRAISMDYYEDKKKVQSYINFTPSNDGSMLVDKLVEALPQGSRVLEIGIGPGKDFDLLARHFDVVGSDYSQEFLRLYRLRNDHAHLLHLDARTLQTDLTFDAIFSNKALIHMSRKELRGSFVRQRDVLNTEGLILHSFWYGREEQEFEGLRLIQHTEQELESMLEDYFEILDIGRHAKMSEDDSVYVLARKKN
ncbi:MAG: class I SAM-dependent methyltransferase [Gammaproteobacteria bacterium]|nr:class I SAM-dependent methyltransferase [Gammaproteobacteria bacterium]MBT8444383.1 class I SAM-dependent methyltransferase [Gammaproteobacteria bacterium]